MGINFFAKPIANLERENLIEKYSNLISDEKLFFSFYFIFLVIHVSENLFSKANSNKHEKDTIP